MRFLLLATCFMVLLSTIKPSSGQRVNKRRNPWNIWDNWGEYGPCSVTCGRGKRTRHRSCLGTNCKGHKTSSTIACFQDKCEKVNTRWDLWDNWGEYGPCSVTCGKGKQTRHRICTGTNCKGDKTSSTIACFQDECEKDRRRRGIWSNWGEYGSCSATCGAGKKTRTRKCGGANCKGKSTATAACFIVECPRDYAPWSRYDTCSAKCGGGVQMRKRRCLVMPCTKHDEEVRNCNEEKCPKVKCEDRLRGTSCRQWRIFCKRNSNIKKQCKKTCGICKDDKEDGSWSKYGPCSATCGVGLKTRIKGSVKQSITCFMDDCEKDDDGEGARWGEWIMEGQCSQTCGGGTVSRKRICSKAGACEGGEKETIKCQTQECKDIDPESEYTEWTRYGSCSDKCGGGISSRTRQCSADICTEQLEETINCNLKECTTKSKCVDFSSFCPESKQFCKSSRNTRRRCPKTCAVCKDKPDEPSWAEYGPCTVTCGAGMKTRYKGSIEQSISCIMEKCPTDERALWGPWARAGPCSVTCGGGTHTRSRTCSTTGACSGKREITENCNTVPCPVWEDWGDWSECSSDCGPGTRTRQRDCSVLGKCDGEKVETDDCLLKDCVELEVAVWEEWDDWTECSATCGPGTKTRHRECSIPGACDGHRTETDDCNLEDCEVPVWEAWDDWSECSMTCGPGTKTRHRKCSIPGECDGDRAETEECNLEDCEVAVWEAWDDWSVCSMTCGLGTKTRHRDCSIPGECDGDRTETDECYLEDCEVAEWSAWQDWTDCTKTCGGGDTSRRRVCSIPDQCDGRGLENRKCNVVSCPVWSPWKDVGDCDVTCGRGKQAQERECLIGSCVGKSDQYVNCDLDECPVWGEWEGWGPCSKECGKGESVRSRTCVMPDKCTGDSEEKQECFVKPCEEPEWSRCSKSCGGGTRRRYSCNGADCMWQFEDCALGECPSTSCGFLGNYLKRRYNVSHQCCRNTHFPVGVQCGRQVSEKSSSEKRIIGGFAAVANQWPWMVAVEMDGKGFCAGVIIGKNFVLSAAHCFAEDSGQPKNVSKWQIIAGILKLEDFRPSLGLKIKKTYIHPSYTYPVADIALVELENDLVYSPSVQALCLPHGEVTPEDSSCWVTGWGVSTVPEAVTNHLQELRILNYNPLVCLEAYGNYSFLEQHVPFLKNNKGFLCAGSLSRSIDSCSGDSGGPLLCQRCDSCSWYVAGIVSFGPNPCALKGVPGIYSKVVYYEDWIFGITKMTRHSVSCSTP